MGWMYHLILGKDVYVVHVGYSAMSNMVNVEELSCIWFDDTKKNWCCQPICIFEPPHNH
jgi:hypothetical protein